MLIDHLRATGAGRDPTLSAEITRLKAQQYVPVVATTHTDHIALYNWRLDIERWIGIRLNHDPLPGIGQRTPRESQLDRLSRIAWCHRIGLASGDDEVFLVYKRSLGGPDTMHLYVDVFAPDSNYALLQRATANPIVLPLGPDVHRAGYYLWAGFAQDSMRLVVLAQCYATYNASPVLTLFSSDAYATPDDLQNRDAWQVAEIGPGGYDLDAVFIGDDLHCVYREAEYPASLSFAPEGGAQNGTLDVTRAIYAPLAYAVVRPTDGSVIQRRTDVPGGEHPQIQNIDPLAITADRMVEGAVTLRGAPDGPVWVSHNVRRSRKHLSLFVSGVWTETRLMQIDETEIATSPIARGDRWTLLDPVLFIPPDADEELRYARPHAPLPAYTPRFTWSVDRGFEMYLVHHRRDVQALVMTLVQHQPLGLPTGDPELNRYAVLGCNHEQVGSETSPPTSAENGQFRPFSFSRLLLVSPSGEPVVIWAGRQEVTVLNSIGGDLAAERWNGLLASYVSIHPGDGGGRVAFGVDLSQSNPVLNQPNRMDPQAVTGTAGGRWEVIQQTGEWMDYGLPVDDDFYLQGETYFTGQDMTLHGLFTAAQLGLIGQLSDDGREVIVEGAEVLAQDGGQELWDTLWSTRDRINEEVTNTTSLASDIGNLEVGFSKFEATWEVRPSGARWRVTVRVGNSYQSQFRFQRRNLGQGRIEARLPVAVRLPNVPLQSPLSTLASISVEISLDYRRHYTPAVLTSDVRGERLDGADASETLDRGSGLRASAMTAKPVGDSSMGATTANVDFQWSAGGHVLIVMAPILIVLLGAIGLGWLGGIIGGLLSSIVGAMASIIGVVVGLVLIAVLIGVLEGVVPGEIERAVQSRITARDFKPVLDGSGLLTNAGEGVAEAIAYRARSANEREATGWNRIAQGVWKMVFVSEGECRVRREG